MAIQWCQFVSGVLYNGLGEYAKALRDAEQAAEQAPELFISMWALPELIEAATRIGKIGLAADALERLAGATRLTDTNWALGIEARSRALVSEDEAAERSYQEAIDRCGGEPRGRAAAGVPAGCARSQTAPEPLRRASFANGAGQPERVS
jgi:tetratricopeptide (TPR) repeat protein